MGTGIKTAGVIKSSTPEEKKKNIYVDGLRTDKSCIFHDDNDDDVDDDYQTTKNV